MKLIRFDGQNTFIRATPHQARECALIGGGEVVPDTHPPVNTQARLTRVRHAGYVAAEVRLIGMRTSPDIYRYIGEL